MFPVMGRFRGRVSLRG